jgi:hypothetical protein
MQRNLLPNNLLIIPCFYKSPKQPLEEDGSIQRNSNQMMRIRAPVGFPDGKIPCHKRHREAHHRCEVEGNVAMQCGAWIATVVEEARADYGGGDQDKEGEGGKETVDHN